MLTRLLTRIETPAFTLLRVVVGLMFSFHGVQKIFGVLTEHATPAVGSQIWVGGVIELVGGVLMAVGLATVWAAFISSGTMAVAYTQFHWKGQLGAKLLPAINEGELALAYAVVMLFIACHGAGPFSVDGWLQRRTR